MISVSVCDTESHFNVDLCN